MTAARVRRATSALGIGSLAFAACHAIAGIEELTPARHDEAGAGDAAFDAGAIDADAAASSFCAQHRGAAFCDDFDDPSPAGTPWSARVVTAGATIDKATSERSRPFALRTSTPSSPGGAVMAALNRAYAGDASRVTFSFDARLASGCDKIGFGAFVVFGSIETAVDAHHVNLLVRSDGTFAEEYVAGTDGGTFLVRPLARSLLADVWTRVVVAVRGLPKAPTMTVSFDGAVVLPEVPIDPKNELSARAWVGVTANGNVPSCTIDYDDVLLETE